MFCHTRPDAIIDSGYPAFGNWLRTYVIIKMLDSHYSMSIRSVVGMTLNQ